MSAAPADFIQLVNVMEFSVNRLMRHLRRLDLTAVNIDPWTILRTASLWLGTASYLDDEKNSRIARGIAICDEAAEALSAVAWIKRIQHIVIPTVTQLAESADANAGSSWSELVQLLGHGVKSLASSVTSGRSDVSRKPVSTTLAENAII